jgi:glycosyltransferase involved in cell wall biosynthesis
MVPLAERRCPLTRVGFTLIGGSAWTGGVQYLHNLLAAAAAHCPERVTPVLFVGDDVSADSLGSLASIPGLTVVRSPAFAAPRRRSAMLRALLTGRDAAASQAFAAQRIDVVFEAAQFFGSRLELPAIAWIPDFQHRHLPQLFPFMARWKRELGFRAQIRGGRTIVLSSEDARRDCEHFYPVTAGRTRVLPFAVPSPPETPVDPQSVAGGYRLPPAFFFLPNQFWQHKNHSLVIDALALLKARGRTDIVIAASGKQLDGRNPAHFPALQARIRAAGIESQLPLLGLIPREHLGALMRACVALLNPSLFEGWSTTVEEARSLGVPLLLSDLAVHREQAGTAARYFDRHSAESLANALADFPALSSADRLAAEGQARTDSAARVVAFAQRFADIVESVKVKKD